MTLTGVRALFVFSPCAEQGWGMLSPARLADLSARLPKCRRGRRFNINTTALRFLSFQRDHSAWRLESCVLFCIALVQERPIPL